MSDRQSACAVIQAFDWPLASRLASENGKRHADQKRERRLDQVVERAADPFDVRLMMAEQFPEWSDLAVCRPRGGDEATSAIIRNMTSPR